MTKHLFSAFILLIFLACGQPPERNCNDFKTGNFTFTATVNGEEKKTTFSRTLDLEVDEYEGKVDSSSIRWINDCEYVLKNLNPKNKAEEKPIHIKILTTTESSYTFEYNVVGDNRKFKGTAHKID
ncbi:DNA topoisomerase IV [Muricauda oceani]|uniref:DNA topoisomerase IV n=1 Tax=Flagellimonas oceani TaxID=2698672 RepID=A0A6G7J0Z5_9FLAO|nr:DNA topoisomerase IV [Allomuricauda oceani]MBW8241530.1 DNA topoisomerase IV [Allomuricauda oceani]QII44475.1 DNA topoisomerase IV [Allomuricauda oceani]